jgi:hypothetical protein
MKTLPESFRSDGFHFQMVARCGDVALFAKTAVHHTIPGFEVVLVRKRETVIFPNGRTTPEHEAMPSPEQWGTYGWTPGTWRMALDMFKSRCWDTGLESKDAIWHWPANRYVPPEKGWVLNSKQWEAKKGNPATWIDSQETEEPASDSVRHCTTKPNGASQGSNQPNTP